jgi:hypothetical protein
MKMKWKRHTGGGEKQPRDFLPCSFIETVGEEEKTRTGRGADEAKTSFLSRTYLPLVVGATLLRMSKTGLERRGQIQSFRKFLSHAFEAVRNSQNSQNSKKI